MDGIEYERLCVAAVRREDGLPGSHPKGGLIYHSVFEHRSFPIGL
jgi:hypothetical protein